MPHKLLLDISPDSFALMVVLGMAATGLVLHAVVDRLISWLGAVVNARGNPR